ncbi:MAG: flagellar brake protein [Deltaproteobacteria bacterium]|jgi:hypothetical protein|nr:flagellar brake protein [Deltaproteobacteria bacterium]
MAETKITLLPDSLVHGLKVRLLAMETTKSKWDTIFIGSKPGRYIVLEQPRVNGLPVKLDDNSKWSVNFINNGQIFNFSCEVIGSCFRPVPLVFLSYPASIETANLRNNKRYPVHIPVTVDRLDETNVPEILTKGLLLDLSWGGCLVASTSEIPPELKLLLNLYIDEQKTINGLQVEKKSGRNFQGTFYSGLSFLPTNTSAVNNQIGELLNDIEHIPLRL